MARAAPKGRPLVYLPQPEFCVLRRHDDCRDQGQDGNHNPGNGPGMRTIQGAPTTFGQTKDGLGSREKWS
jgi:hypothetical protein